MSTFRFDLPLTSYLLWNAIGFAGAAVVNSFIEWIAHRHVLHSARFVRFAYELHDRTHHVLFGADETYHAQNEEMKKHITFVPRDYFLFLLVTTPIWIGVELLLQRPILIGCVLITLVGLQMFNSLHLRFHLPTDTWFQRTGFFRYLKEHHRLHHADTRKNFNVYFFPLADLVLGTLLRQGSAPATAPLLSIPAAVSDDRKP
jgi:hypothetical protein